MINLVSVILLAFSFVFAGSVFLKYMKIWEDLKNTRAELKEARAVLQIRVKARTKELEELAGTLERKVEKRTQEIQQRVTELERFHKVTVDRELKMMDLKQEIKKMEVQLRDEKFKHYDGKPRHSTKKRP